jgi:hypothetical protein
MALPEAAANSLAVRVPARIRLRISLPVLTFIASSMSRFSLPESRSALRAATR